MIQKDLQINLQLAIVHPVLLSQSWLVLKHGRPALSSRTMLTGEALNLQLAQSADEAREAVYVDTSSRLRALRASVPGSTQIKTNEIIVSLHYNLFTFFFQKADIGLRMSMLITI